MKAGILVPFEVPLISNYVRVKIAESDVTIDIADVSDTDIDQLGAEWVKAVKARAETRRIMRHNESQRQNIAW